MSAKEQEPIYAADDQHGSGVTRPLSSLFSALGFEQPSVAIHSRQNPQPHVITKPWVLCVDDDDALIEGLMPRLESRGFEVIRAYQGMDGFRYAFEFNPIVILLDLCMPGGNGQEMLGRLRHSECTRDIPVVIMTGLDEPGLKQRMLAAGASDFFRKPVSHNLLVEVVSYYTGEVQAN